MMGAKRFFLPESNQDAGESALRNKRIMAGSISNSNRAEPSQQQLMETPKLDVQRAESSHQHVRALNSQFASWVQTQLKNHPDELWEDGVKDYLSHASNIMEKYSDVVQWLKANALKGDNSTGTGSSPVEKNIVPGIKNSEIKISQGKSEFSPVGSGTSFGISWGSGGSSPSLGSVASQIPPIKNEIKPFQAKPIDASVGTTTSSATWGSGGSSPALGSVASQIPPIKEIKPFQVKPVNASVGTTTSSATWGSGGSSPALGSVASQIPPIKNEIKPFQVKPVFASVGTTTSSATSWSFGGTSSAVGSSPSEKSPISSLFQGKIESAVGSSPSEKSPVSSLFQGKTESAPAGTTTSFGTPWSSGVFSNSQTPAFFGSQVSAPVNHDASEKADDENDLEQPSSPSVKKTEEKGIVVVHEVKCKLYVKSSDPNDKDTWKDKGTGHLSIKCQEGLSKGTKESKPTILIRNDVGKILLNALIYQGIRTNAKKKSIVAIFHTSGDGDDDSVVPRTFLFRLRTEEDQIKLETAIKEYAPQA